MTDFAFDPTFQAAQHWFISNHFDVSSMTGDAIERARVLGLTVRPEDVLGEMALPVEMANALATELASGVWISVREVSRLYSASASITASRDSATASAA